MGLKESGRVVWNQEGLVRCLHCVLHHYTDGALWDSAPHHRKANSSTNTPGLFEMLREASLSLFHPWFVQLGNKESSRMSLPGLL